MENKERNVINKYLDVVFDFMRWPFWLKNYIVKINHRKDKTSSIPAFYVKVKGIFLSFSKYSLGLVFIIIKYKKIRNIYQEINPYIALSLVISRVSGIRYISIFPHCSQIVVNFL